MSNTKEVSQRSKLNAIVRAYILNAIDGEGYGKKLNTIEEKLQFLADTFKSEYVFSDNLKRYGSYQNVMREWIMGLPSAFNVEYRNHAIIELAKEWGSIPANATEKQEEKIIENWFNFIAAKTMQMFRRYNIDSFYL